MDWTHNKGQPFIAIPPASMLDALCPCAIPVPQSILRGISSPTPFLSPFASLQAKQPLFLLRGWGNLRTKV